jgi:histidine triad (HIT) family protein
MSRDDCIFCKIIAGDIPCHKIYENADVLAFLDVGPLSDGHTLVIPKLHFQTVDKCPSEILSSIAARLDRIAAAVVAATDCDGYNILCNNGRAAGQVVEHVHFHVIGRKTGDGIFSQWPAKKYAQGQAEAMAEKIRKNL